MDEDPELYTRGLTVSAGFSVVSGAVPEEPSLTTGLVLVEGPLPLVTSGSLPVADLLASLSTIVLSDPPEVFSSLGTPLFPVFPPGVPLVLGSG